MEQRMVYTKEGFTLMEILIAIAILGILVAIGLPAYFGYLETAKKNATRTQLKMVEQAIQTYYLDTGEFPETLEDLVRRPSDQKMAEKWQDGGYFKKPEVPRDGWNQKFVYQRTPSGTHEYELRSEGPRGKKQPIDVWKI